MSKEQSKRKFKFLKKVAYRGLDKDGIPRLALDIPRLYIHTKEVERNDIFLVTFEFREKGKQRKTSEK